MNILRVLVFPFFLFGANSFILSGATQRLNSAIRTFESYDNLAVPTSNFKGNPRFPPKIKAFVRLSRPENVLPALVLNFAGGWLANPSLSALIRSPPFFASSAITTLVMTYSMFVNDLFDIELDRINNPSRPLVTGEITRTEAVSVSAIMLSLAEILNMYFIPNEQRIVTHLAIFVTTIYTPVLKKLCFIKNLACASLVAHTLYFTGRSVCGSAIKSPFLKIATQFIFWGSLQNEILLDICDAPGDAQNGIRTLPVIFGRNVAFTMANLIVHFNVIWNLYYSMSRLTNYVHGFIIMALCYPLVKGLSAIKDRSDMNEIKKVIKSTSLPMVMVLLYLCMLRRITP
jgi:geranylgeranylglycerol-phosphate geranylgeranyltransferase